MKLAVCSWCRGFDSTLGTKEKSQGLSATPLLEKRHNCCLSGLLLTCLNMQAVRWSEEVVDNELMNKKKSKSESAGVAFPQPVLLLAARWLLTVSLVLIAECCIFHKQKSFGDWSDDDSDDECGDCGKEDTRDKAHDKQEAAQS